MNQNQTRNSNEGEGWGPEGWTGAGVGWYSRRTKGKGEVKRKAFPSSNRHKVVSKFAQ